MTSLRVTLLCMLIPVAARAQSDSWAASVRTAVAHRLGGVNTPPGAATLAFTVTADGTIVGVRVADGDPAVGGPMAAALRSSGRVRAPPDHRPHSVSFPVRSH